MKDRREDGMYRALLGGALVLGLVAGGCTPHASVGADPVGPGYVSGGGEWNSGGGVTVSWGTPSTRCMLYSLLATCRV